jgi:hypothetical protein
VIPPWRDEALGKPLSTTNRSSQTFFHRVFIFHTGKCSDDFPVWQVRCTVPASWVITPDNGSFTDPESQWHDQLSQHSLYCQTFCAGAGERCRSGSEPMACKRSGVRISVPPQVDVKSTTLFLIASTIAIPVAQNDLEHLFEPSLDRSCNRISDSAIVPQSS